MSERTVDECIAWAKSGEWNAGPRSVEAMKVLAREVARLRAGGCARDQKTTQFCAEAVALAKERDDWKSMAAQLEKELRGALNHGSSFLVNGRATTFHWNPEEGENTLAAYKKLIKTP